jgi:uncharacterized protein YciI
MPYFALVYDLVDDYLSRRTPLREEHLALAEEARSRGEILLAGAFNDPMDKALLIFKSADSSTPESFAKNDPYVKHGLVRRWEVRPWSVVIGNRDSA